jgi:hypothetical protein
MRVAAMLLLLVLCAAVSEGLVQAYSVAPVMAQWSGKVRGDGGETGTQYLTLQSSGHTQRWIPRDASRFTHL